VSCEKEGRKKSEFRIQNSEEKKREKQIEQKVAKETKNTEKRIQSACGG
jgi:hypothetical protein